MARILWLIIFFNVLANYSFSQETLEILFTKFGSFKKYQINVNEALEYKLKGEGKFRTKKILHLRDSTIYFENDQQIRLSDIKCIRFRKNNHLITAFGNAFQIAGFGFIIIDTFNNVILDRPTIVNEKAVIISASFLATSLLLKRMSFKNIRITKNKTLRIVNFDYEHLNASD